MCDGKTTSSTQELYCEYPSRIIGWGGYFSLKNSLGFHQEIRTDYKNGPVADSPAIPAMRTNAAPVSDYPYNSLTPVSGPVSYTVPYVDMCSHPTVYAAGGLFIAHIPLQWGGYAQALSDILFQRHPHCAYRPTVCLEMCGHPMVYVTGSPQIPLLACHMEKKCS